MLEERTNTIRTSVGVGKVICHLVYLLIIFSLIKKNYISNLYNEYRKEDKLTVCIFQE